MKSEKAFSFTPELFSIEAASHYLGISPAQTKKYIQCGRLATFRLPRAQGEEYLERTLIKRGELDRLIESGLDL